MTGVYVHIPYCVKKCAYCDFCSVPRDMTAAEYPDALCREIELSRDRLPYAGPVPSVFFGGGTPTVLPADDLVRILNTIRNTYEVRSDGEITVATRSAPTGRSPWSATPARRPTRTS